MFMSAGLISTSLSVPRFSGNVRQLPPQGDHRELLEPSLIKSHSRSGTPVTRNWEDVSNCWGVSVNRTRIFLSGIRVLKLQAALES